MKTPTPRTLLNFLQAQGVSNSLQNNWPAQTTRKGNRKDCCLIKQEENIPCRRPSQGRGASGQKAWWHNTSYGRSRLKTGQTGRGFLFFFLQISDQHHKAEGKFNLPCGVREGPVECPSPGQAFSPHNKMLCIRWCKQPDAYHTHFKKNRSIQQSPVLSNSLSIQSQPYILSRSKACSPGQQ